MEIFNTREYNGKSTNKKIGDIERCTTMGVYYYKITTLENKVFIRKSLLSCKDLLRMNNKSYNKYLSVFEGNKKKSRKKKTL